MNIKKLIMGKNGYFYELHISMGELLNLVRGEELLTQIDNHTLYVKVTPEE